MDTDFIGFQYGEAHSRDFDLYRVSISNRYEEQLIPQFNENKTAVPGGDGTYFFDANYTQRQFKVSFAFDNLTETQYRQLRLWLGNKDTFKQLIFDERPYKYYMAKPSAPPTLKTICFDEEYIENNTVKTKRIYKGEGDVTFVCYYPFARTINGKKYLANYANFSTPVEYGLHFGYVYIDGVRYDDYYLDFSMLPVGSLGGSTFNGKKFLYYKLNNERVFINYKETPFWINNDRKMISSYIGGSSPCFKFTDSSTVDLSNFNYPMYEIPTKQQWHDSVGWMENRSGFDIFTTTGSSAVAYLYNPGDLSADYKITLDYIPESISMINDSFGEVQLVHFSNQTTMPTIANRIQIDSKTNMIKVGTTADPSSTAAVDFVPVEMFNTAADVMNFVTIPVDAQDTFIGVPTSTVEANTRMVITGVPSSGSPSASIDYDYLYY